MNTRRGAGPRAGMTLIEVILAIVILSGAMLGLANFGRKFQHNTSASSDSALASDLATRRLEDVKSFRSYLTLVSIYNNVTETFASDPIYKGFTRTTYATRCDTTASPHNDYVTVTVTVTGNSLAATMRKTTIIARF